MPRLLLRGRLVAACAVASAVALALALSACSSSGGGADASGSGIPDGPIKIGMIAELSGPSSAIGNYQVATQTALADYVNAHGGIAGHQVKLIVENNQGDAAVAVSAARKLVKEGIAGAVYSGLTSSGKDQVLSIFAQAKIPAVDPVPQAQYDDPKLFPFFFTDNPIDPNSMTAEAAFAKKRGFDKIGQLGDSTPFGKSLEENFAKKAADNGLTIVKTIDYPSTATDMTTQLAQLREAGAQTLGLWCNIGCGKVFDGLRQLNWSPNILTTHVVYYVAWDSVKNLGSNTWGDCPISVPQGQQPPQQLADIINSVAPKTGGITVTSQGIPLNADSWLILKYGIEKAKSLDGVKVRDAIESIDNQSFSDPDVKYSFSPQHHAGFEAANPLDIAVCGFGGLGPMMLPLRAS